MSINIVRGLQSEIPVPQPQPAAALEPALKALRNMRIALVTAGGVYPCSQKPFHLAGDYTFREISDDLTGADLRVSHHGYDNVDVNKDINCMFPIDILHNLREERFIKNCSPVHIGFMGGGGDYERMMHETAPEIAERLKRECVDGVVLTAG